MRHNEKQNEKNSPVNIYYCETDATKYAYVHETFLPNPALICREVKITSSDDAVVVVVTELGSESKTNTTSNTAVSSDCCGMT